MVYELICGIARMLHKVRKKKLLNKVFFFFFRKEKFFLISSNKHKYKTILDIFFKKLKPH